jgi:hypothetical protein
LEDSEGEDGNDEDVNNNDGIGGPTTMGSPQIHPRSPAPAPPDGIDDDDDNDDDDDDASQDLYATQITPALDPHTTTTTLTLPPHPHPALAAAAAHQRPAQAATSTTRTDGAEIATMSMGRICDPLGDPMTMPIDQLGDAGRISQLGGAGFIDSAEVTSTVFGFQHDFTLGLGLGLGLGFQQDFTARGGDRDSRCGVTSSMR